MEVHFDLAAMILLRDIRAPAFEVFWIFPPFFIFKEFNSKKPPILTVKC